ncbi:protein-L-isoaspartate(D-aspartate) O-methyltransferase [Luminiphilus sp.]|jgi:protein-L-isoaspartate(D-aspartate) O-methyltransferase|nr:protein-L-isoaspartate(D-aspartate) O-methyltransferase [Halieaceae bacterium]MDA7584518.1 protein-L-isoaspartate(D-aspartate) O-methyltransferase [Luminiphilus sp.]MDA8658707.1 protein-L-isoaspartate(D-aspartate) O-methyltransferase [Luminiphilus sp.]MDA8827233.1 protein-L-isoaspartate(D-aspartate) O-methyltransferase [Luminiphilus sp.]MDA9580249.1 protein-L-isoaspartate(D-aspartate) O-methyltransferase [Luminiphilus sp.]
MDRDGIGMTSMRTRQRLVQRLSEQGITSTEVLEAVRSTPRHLFVDEALAHRAYEDTALPIGWNQTLSQPYIVAKMTELALANGTPGKVLEIGSGSGYQTAILAQVSGEVFAMERVKGLSDRSRKRFRELRLRNVQCRLGDGLVGWPDKGPFDVILSAAAPEQVPPALLEQLAIGGRLVMPVGNHEQDLIVVHATPSGFETEVIEPVNFVPMLPGVER